MKKKPQNNEISLNDVLITIIKPGDGKTFAQKGQKVTVLYTGTLENGKQFDTNRDPGGEDKPFQFQIGQNKVIQGWEIGIPKMSLGERSKLVIPPSLGYGNDAQEGIPKNSVLVFDVQILKIN